MLETLKMVRGAVSTKDVVPVLSHFMIYNGRIQGANGKVAIDAALPELPEISVVVPAERFLKAIDACSSEPVLTLKDDKLQIKAGKFTAKVSVMPSDAFPLSTLDDGRVSVLPLNLLDVLRKLYPFVSTDASRPWACSILLSDGYAYATNNVVLARTKLDWHEEPIALPVYAIDELLRIRDMPKEFRVSENALFFVYSKFWLKAQIFLDVWPETLVGLCEKITGELDVVPADLLSAVTTLKAFFPNEKAPIVVFGEEGVSTQDGAHSASLAIGTMPTGLYRFEPLTDVLLIAEKADFTKYPAPIPFRGQGVEGLLVGMRI